ESSLLAWPFTHFQVMVWRLVASFSACQSSRFFTGFLSAVRQPFFFQPCIQLCTPFLTYWLSVCSSTVQGRLRALSASMAAVSSILLLVVSCSPPQSSLVLSPYCRIAPQPPGPGLPEQAPSVWIMTVSVMEISGIVLLANTRGLGKCGDKCLARNGGFDGAEF